MDILGSQRREDINESKIYSLLSGPDKDGIVVIHNTITSNCENWIANDDFAGYVLVIHGLGYEFIRSLKKVSL